MGLPMGPHSMGHPPIGGMMGPHGPMMMPPPPPRFF